MVFVSDFCHYSTNNRLIVGLPAPPSLKTIIHFYDMQLQKVCIKLHRRIIVNFTTECLEMTKKLSIFQCCFLAVNGLKSGILAKNRLTGIFFTLLFAENRKFVFLFVLQIFAFKVMNPPIVGRLDNYKISMINTPCVLFQTTAFSVTQSCNHFKP